LTSLIEKGEEVQAGFQEFHYRVPVDEDELAVVALLADVPGPRRLAILLHGGPAGDKDGPEALYADLAKHLAEVGICSVRFDFRGCGQSTGRYRDMTIDRQVAELAAVRRFVDTKLKVSSVAMVGESYGATIGIRGLEAGYQAVVLLWPCIWLLDGAFESYVTPDKMRAAEADGYIVEDGEEIGIDFLRELVEVQDVGRALRDFGSAPTLFIHGEADTEVPFAQSVRAAELVTGPTRLVPVPDGDHCLVEPGEREIVYRETVAWLREYL
jgi:hypothetical protein